MSIRDIETIFYPGPQYYGSPGDFTDVTDILNQADRVKIEPNMIRLKIGNCPGGYDKLKVSPPKVRITAPDNVEIHYRVKPFARRIVTTWTGKSCSQKSESSWGSVKVLEPGSSVDIRSQKAGNGKIYGKLIELVRWKDVSPPPPPNGENGEDGANGENGEDGADGEENGDTPPPLPPPSPSPRLPINPLLLAVIGIGSVAGIGTLAYFLTG